MGSPKNIHTLKMGEIENFLNQQLNPKRFIVRERFKFWNDMQRKPDKTVQELAARILQDAATCDFLSIRNPQDEALRQRFICSVSSEVFLNALFKISDDQLDFDKAVQVAIESEDAAKVAKETVYASRPNPVSKVKQYKDKNHRKGQQQSKSTDPELKCYRCGRAHKAPESLCKDSKCHFCD